MSKENIEKTGKYLVDRSDPSHLSPEELEAYISGETLSVSKMKHLRICPICSDNLSILRDIDNTCSEDTIPQKLGATIKSKLAEFRKDRFRKLTSELIAEIYPDKLDQWEKDWEAYFTDKSAGDAVESAEKSWRGHESVEQENFQEIITGIGSIWGDTEDHHVDKNQTFLKEKLKEAGISIDTFRKILSHLKNKNNF